MAEPAQTGFSRLFGIVHKRESLFARLIIHAVQMIAQHGILRIATPRNPIERALCRPDNDAASIDRV